IGPQKQAGTAPDLSAPPGMQSIPQPAGGPAPGVGPQSQIGPGAPTMSAMPMMPMMPVLPGEKGEFRASGQKTNLLGFACERYELKQRGQTLEVWATEHLFPYQPYARSQPHRFGPRGLEEQ